MKRSKVLFFVIAAFFMFALTACVVDDGGGHTHSYGEWLMTKAPTETEVGVKERQCTLCDVFERGEVAVLTDDAVWTVVDITNSTCKVEGSKKYSSEEFGTVLVSLPLAEHTHEVWAFVETPTETTSGVCKGACVVCGDEIEEEVPALTDSSVWQLIDEVEVNYNQAGYRTYQSTYGTLTVDFEKFVAPYDGKTYSSFAFDAEREEGGWENKVINVETAWSNAQLVINENGVGVGEAFPFRGHNQIKMIDPLTGKVEITNTPIDETDPENPVLKVEEAVTYVSYVDMKSGIMVRPFRDSFNYVHVFTPFEVGNTSPNALASAWDNAMAIQYTYGEQTYTMFIKEDQVFFNVSFKNELGENVSVEECYHAPYLYVTDQEGGLIASYGFDGEKEVELDGFEGKYAGESELFVSGFGTVTLNGETGTYVVNEGEGFTLGVYVSNQYFEVTLNQETKTYTLVKPEVTISFETGEYATLENQVVNKNIALELPQPENEKYTFKGWFYDEKCTQSVEESFVPTADVTLYSLWKEKVVINLVGVKGEDKSVIYLGEGDVIGEFLPKYTVDEVAFEAFRGWYIDEAFTETLTEDAAVTPEDTNFTIYAKWEKLPAYYGERKGVELWSEHSGNSSVKTLKIDENGVISGLYSGVVVDYNEETHAITWKAKATDTKTYKLYFDEASDVIIADYYKSDEVEKDFYIFSKHQTNGKVKEFYGLQCLKPNGTTLVYYAHLITLETENGDMEVLRYGSNIYSNIIVTNTLGETLTSATVKNSKTVVIKDATTNETILALSSLGESFDAESDTVALDNFYGTYTKGEETIVLDGTGNITYGEKTGKYSVSKTDTYGFDVFLENETEYYQLTLSDKTFEMVMPKATVTFVTGEGHVVIEAQQYNTNVAAKLPDGADEGWVFNGWFLDEAFKNAVPETFIPTKDITLYAKYSAPAVLTIVYNSGVESKEVIYSVGDIATVEMPVYAKHAFMGWYTTEDFQENSKWTSGAEMTEDVTIYAKWEVAPVYNNFYVPTDIELREDNVTAKASLYTRTGAKVDIDPYGKAPKTGYPFSSGEIEVTDYNKETGRLLIHCGSSVYEGFIDPVTGIIIINHDTGEGKDFTELFFLNPFEAGSITSKISASYWNGGKSHAIQYTHEEIVYSVFVHNNKVYFNVQFKDAEGQDVLGVDCYTASTLYVNDAEGNLIAKFGHDGTMLQPLDGFEGTYTSGENTLVIDGVKVATLNGTAGLYSAAKEGSSYTHDLYVGGEYFELTLNMETKTYTVNKPMVTVTFNTNDLAMVDAMTVNKNIQITLPTITNDNYIFRGWYKDQEFTQAVDNAFTPTETITLYAKWDAKVTLVVVYGKGLELVTKVYGVGDIPVLDKPLFTDGQVFNGWYTDAECTVQYVEGTPISESIIVYCKWMDAVAMYGNYIGFNTYGKGPNQNCSGVGTKKLAIDAYGNVSDTCKGVITDYNPETGVFTLVDGASKKYGFFDLQAGIIAIRFGSSTDGLGDDFYIFVNAETVDTSKEASAVWASGLVRLVKITADGEDRLVFVKDGIVYSDVTYTSTDGEVELKSVASANQVTIVSSTGEVIASYVKGANGLELAA